MRRPLLACTGEGDIVFDPFCGSGTTAVAAKELNRFFVGTELDGVRGTGGAQDRRRQTRGVLREILVPRL